MQSASLRADAAAAALHCAATAQHACTWKSSAPTHTYAHTHTDMVKCQCANCFYFIRLYCYCYCCLRSLLRWSAPTVKIVNCSLSAFKRNAINWKLNRVQLFTITVIFEFHIFPFQLVPLHLYNVFCDNIVACIDLGSQAQLKVPLVAIKWLYNAINSTYIRTYKHMQYLRLV